MPTRCGKLPQPGLPKVARSIGIKVRTSLVGDPDRAPTSPLLTDDHECSQSDYICSEGGPDGKTN